MKWGFLQAKLIWLADAGADSLIGLRKPLSTQRDRGSHAKGIGIAARPTKTAEASLASRSTNITTSLRGDKSTLGSTKPLNARDERGSLAEAPGNTGLFRNR